MRIQASTPVRVACALLAAWIFILSLAGVNPAMHSWLHAEPGCAHEGMPHNEDAPQEPTDDRPHADGHYCGVIALQGGVAPTIVVELPTRTAHQRIHFESHSPRLLSHTNELRLQARAPPIEI